MKESHKQEDVLRCFFTPAVGLRSEQFKLCEMLSTPFCNHSLIDNTLILTLYRNLLFKNKKVT